MISRYQDFQYSLKKNRNLPLFLQLAFLFIGALLIIAFALLSESKSKAANTLLSPITSTKFEEPLKKELSYKLVYGDAKKIIYKETYGDTQTLKLLYLSTNLTENIVSAKRIGNIGFLNDKIYLFLEDKEGAGRFVITKYNIDEKTLTPFLAFDGPWEASSDEIDQLVSISPSKTRLVITHKSGIVIYTLGNENEVTILENNSLSYHQPIWITDNQLLVYQEANNNSTPLIVSITGTIQAVLPADLNDLSPSLKGLPLIGVSSEGLQIVDLKKLTTVLSDTKTKYFQPIWQAGNILVLVETSSVPQILKADKTGKKLVTLKEFETGTILKDLISDPLQENAFFIAFKKTNLSINVTFYKISGKEDKTIGFYSITKNL